jgi:hypothetical protein
VKALCWVDRSSVQFSSTPTTFAYNTSTNTWVPRGSPSLGHMAPPNSWTDATCQPQDGPCALFSQQPYLPPVCPVNVVPCHVSPYGRAMWHLYEHATCHPSSGDTCHLLVGPCQLYKTCCQLCLCHVSHCHVIMS